MGNYNFVYDFSDAYNAEVSIGKLLKLSGYKVVEHNNDNRYDFKVSKNGLELTIEIKDDKSCSRTGNLAIEFSAWGKPSGISITEADFYWIKAHLPGGGISHLILPVASLKWLIANKKYTRCVTGGDTGSNTKMYLFKYEDLERYSV